MQPKQQLKRPKNTQRNSGTLINAKSLSCHMSGLVILDRDGVINQDSENFIKSVAEFIPIPGSLEAITQLCQAGFSIMVATNQSGIARGYFSLEALHAMHEKLQSLLAPLGGKIDHFYFCPHGPDDHCTCRKPKPGMILQIAEEFFSKNVSSELEKTYVVGDSLRDLDAGRAAGARVALVKTGKGQASLDKITQDTLSPYAQIPVYDDLLDFTQHFLQSHQQHLIT